MESSALRGTITRLLVKVMHGIFALNFTLYIAKDFVPTGGYTFADKIVCYKWWQIYQGEVQIYEGERFSSTKKWVRLTNVIFIRYFIILVLRINVTVQRDIHFEVQRIYPSEDGCKCSSLGLCTDVVEKLGCRIVGMELRALDCFLLVVWCLIIFRTYFVLFV